MRLAEAVKFFQLLFPSEQRPKDSSIIVFTTPRKEVSWCQTLEQASEAVGRSAKQNVYFGACLQNKANAIIEARTVEHNKAIAENRKPKNISEGNVRGFNTTACAMPALWLDIDIAGPNGTHSDSKKPLPSSIAAALELLTDAPFPPTTIINTGGGIQPWWVFDELLHLESPEEREDALDLSRRWNHAYIAYAQARGYTIDSTFDLARVMRVVGTKNVKREPALDVETLRFTGAKYRVEDLRGWIESGAPSPVKKVSPQLSPNQYVAGGSFVINPEATPPFDKMDALLAAEPKVKKTWERTRKDLADGSRSAYDLSIAIYCAMADFSDQEIVDTMIGHRRKHGDEIKTDPNYYARTIQRARMTANRSVAVDSIMELSAKLATCEEESAITPDERSSVLDRLSNAFGKRIKRIIKYTQEPPKYRIETNRGAVEVGDASHLINQASIRSAMAAAEGHYIPKFKAPEWDAIAQALLDACEEVDTGPEGTAKGQMTEWLSLYLESNPPNEYDPSSISGGNPCYRKEEPNIIYIFGTRFREWLMRRLNEKITGKELGILVQRVKGHSHVLAMDDEGRKSSRHVYAIPMKNAFYVPAGRMGDNGKA